MKLKDSCLGYDMNVGDLSYTSLTFPIEKSATLKEAAESSVLLRHLRRGDNNFDRKNTWI